MAGTGRWTLRERRPGWFGTVTTRTVGGARIEDSAGIGAARPGPAPWDACRDSCRLAALLLDYSHVGQAASGLTILSVPAGRFVGGKALAAGFTRAMCPLHRTGG